MALSSRGGDSDSSETIQIRSKKFKNRRKEKRPSKYSLSLRRLIIWVEPTSKMFQLVSTLYRYQEVTDLPSKLER